MCPPVEHSFRLTRSEYAISFDMLQLCLRVDVCRLVCIRAAYAYTAKLLRVVDQALTGTREGHLAAS